MAYAMDGDIYVADWDGANAVRIADGRPEGDCRGRAEYWADGMISSPDGRHLAYRHENCSGPVEAWPEVVITDLEGNVVASFPSDGWQVAWSPDSTRVAVWVRLWETIGIFGLDGERQALVTMPAGWAASGDKDPSWMPDGESLLVEGGVDLIVPVDGSEPRPLPWGEAAWPTFSPDGSRVAYVTMAPDGSEQFSLVVAEADGSDPQVVLEEWVGNPTWSPTGNELAYVSGGVPELRLIDLGTGAATVLAEGGTDTSFSPIDFSPAGDRLLFVQTVEQGDVFAQSLWTVNIDGSDLRRLGDGAAVES